MTNTNTTTNAVVELNDFYQDVRMKRFEEARKITNSKVRQSAFEAIDKIPDVVNTSLTCDEVKEARHGNRLSPTNKTLRNSFVITSDYHLMRPLYFHEHSVDWDLPKKYQQKDYEMSKGGQRDLYDQMIKNHFRFSKEAE